MFTRECRKKKDEKSGDARRAHEDGGRERQISQLYMEIEQRREERVFKNIQMGASSFNQ
jgi:hypothetical protein